MSKPQLCFLAFEVSDLGAWERLATQVLGLEVVQRSPERLSLRMDGHAQRFFLHAGPADDLHLIAWEYGDAKLWAEAVSRLQGHGVPVIEADQDTCEHYQCQAMACFEDPGGVKSALVYGATRQEAPFESALVPGGFVADALGLGHVVLNAASKAESVEFYQTVLAFGLSDHITCQYFGFDVDLAFMHINPRHHSVAFGGPQAKKLHHFMLEAKAMDAVGLCYDRALRARVPIASTLGRHPNDQMFSFYAETPSGFQFEFGWGGRQIDEAQWQPVTHDRISEWGHHPAGWLAHKLTVKAPKPEEEA